MKAIMPRRTALPVEPDTQRVLATGDEWAPAPRHRVPANTVSFGSLLREVLADAAADMAEQALDGPAATRGDGRER